VVTWKRWEEDGENAEEDVRRTHLVMPVMRNSLKFFCLCVASSVYMSLTNISGLAKGE
jgi:hypothetical protein